MVVKAVEGDDIDGTAVNSMDGVGDGGNTVGMKSWEFVSALLGVDVMMGLLLSLLHQVCSMGSYAVDEW